MHFSLSRWLQALIALNHYRNSLLAMSAEWCMKEQFHSERADARAKMKVC
jgi:hypothetical protein